MACLQPEIIRVIRVLIVVIIIIGVEVIVIAKINVTGIVRSTFGKQPAKTLRG